MAFVLVITTLPDESSARALAQALVESRLAACVNVLGSCHSVYRWQGAVEETGEVPLLIKARAERYAELEALICRRHPYQVPEIIALPIEGGLPAYMAWLDENTAAP